MSIIGGNIETKEIGLSIGTTGTHHKTVYDSSLNSITLEQVTVDGSGNPVYADEGYWTSEVINLGDNFSDFEKLFTTHIDSGSSNIAVETRVSNDGLTWSDWIAVALDGAIQSETKRYIQVKISLFAGFITDNFNIDKNEYVDSNKYVETKTIVEGSYIIPQLTSNTSSNIGFAFAKSIYSTSYPVWRAFDKGLSAYSYYSLASDINDGYVGFYFSTKRRIYKYKITSANVLNASPKNFFLEASSDTSTGLNGTWEILDTQNISKWEALEVKEFEINNSMKYQAYRIRWTSNNGSTMFTGLGELDFFESEETNLQLKREHSLDMTLDTSWTGEGSLHRKLISKDDWLRIDKLNVEVKK